MIIIIIISNDHHCCHCDHIVEVVVNLDVEAGPIDDLGLRQLQLGCEQWLHLKINVFG